MPRQVAALQTPRVSGHASGSVVGPGEEKIAYPEMGVYALLSILDEAGRLYENV